ncbi:hypothetical protein [Methylobacterium iners]|uniref:Uncharacterized protein n=1 Tax=Methylobacterium iners TaxID=418707 RepID=A0ABQ4S4P3_9HYPH|nr:hypothetical protein [Methylobacterium iners]GJD97540.1 hypothetical protein OCOJLMKI_4772 [Methylobacterium iners]
MMRRRASEEAGAPLPDRYLVTPDGRYFVVRGRLWRRTNPALPEDSRRTWVKALMAARRAVGVAKRAGDDNALTDARAAVERAKVALGERGPVWWEDGAPDENRRMAARSSYAAWFAALVPDAPS